METKTESKVNQDIELAGATFQYMTGPDQGMMKSMIGRDKIKGELAVLPGLELGIQKIYEIRNTVPINSPDKRSSQAIIRDNFDDNFELYLVRPNPKGASHAMIWSITPDEFKLAREWELVDQGMQEDLKALAITEDGKFRSVTVHGLQRPPFRVDRIAMKEGYSPFIVDPAQMLKEADKSREKFAE